MTFDTAEKQAALLLRTGELCQLQDFLSNLKTKNKNLVILDNLLSIFYEEAKNDTPVTVFDYSLDFNVLIKHYITTKLLLRRFDFNIPEKYLKDFFDYCEATQVSEYFIDNILSTNIFHPGQVIKEINYYTN